MNQEVRMKWYYWVGLTVAVTVITYLIKIPLPSKGYFNFGDIAVVFSGLFLGWRGGAVAGGIGSALADIVGGFAVFSPLTLLAKGLEGMICGFARGGKGVIFFVFNIIGVLMMVAVYYFGEYSIPIYGGVGAAISELIPNLIQAVGGAIGGIILFRMIDKYISVNKDINK